MERGDHQIGRLRPGAVFDGGCEFAWELLGNKEIIIYHYLKIMY